MILDSCMEQYRVNAGISIWIGRREMNLSWTSEIVKFETAGLKNNNSRRRAASGATAEKPQTYLRL